MIDVVLFGPPVLVISALTLYRFLRHRRVVRATVVGAAALVFGCWVIAMVGLAAGFHDGVSHPLWVNGVAAIMSVAVVVWGAAVLLGAVVLAFSFAGRPPQGGKTP